jgi:hypothetical protein
MSVVQGLRDVEVIQTERKVRVDAARVEQSKSSEGTISAYNKRARAS